MAARPAAIEAGIEALPEAAAAVAPPASTAVTGAILPAPVIELEMASAEMSRLLRCAALAAIRHGRTRTDSGRRIWHDTAAGSLRGHRLALCRERDGWSLERLRPAEDDALSWSPASPAMLVAAGPDPGILHRRLTPSVVAELVPVAAFAFTRRVVPVRIGGEAGRVEIQDGALRGVANDQPSCRVILSGPTGAMADLALRLCGEVSLTVPQASLAACAIAHATGEPPPPPKRSAPAVPSGLAVEEALGMVVAHLTGAMLGWAARIPPASAVVGDFTPVHQMRVAVRRLRSALIVFRRALVREAPRALFCEVGAALKASAAILGVARDWDVFLGGVGMDLAQAFGHDKRVMSLLAASARKRQAAYAALHAHLHGAIWRDLALRLALLPVARPWSSAGAGERDEFGAIQALDEEAGPLGSPVEAYAARMLARGFKPLLAFGGDIAALAPDAMHDARKAAKRLRYACEFFSPLFPAKPVRRFLETLEDAQESLGAVNDGHVAASLMQQVAVGAEARFAAGVVQGFVAARSGPSARRAGKAWTKLLKQEGFWRQPAAGGWSMLEKQGK